MIKVANLKTNPSRKATVSKKANTTRKATARTKTSKTTTKKVETKTTSTPIMTAGEALKQLMIKHNTYQEYRKNNKKSYNMVTTELTIAFGNTLSKKELQELTKAYAIIKVLGDKLYDYSYVCHKAKTLIGKELLTKSEYEHVSQILDSLHPTDLPKEEKTTDHTQAVKSAKAATRKTNKAITKALKQEEKEVK